MAPSTSSPTSSHNEEHRVTAAAPKTFKQRISVQLDDSNYLQWKQQVEGVLRGTKMVKHVVSPQIPLVYLTDAARAAGTENPVYTEWEEQDSLLCTWILSTISPSLLSRFVRLRQAWQVWEEVHLYCSTQMKTRSRQLRSELRNISKGSRTITEFIARVRTISESLMSIGDPISHRDLIELVLEALPEEFNPVVVSVNSHDVLISLDELESQLLTLEARNEKFKKALLSDPASVNLTQSSNPDDKNGSNQNQFGTYSDQNQNSNFSGNPPGNNPYQQYNPNFGGSFGQNRGRGNFRGGRSRGRGGGRGTGRGYLQCQICYKTGHDASICHFRLVVPPNFEGYGGPSNHGNYGAQSNYGTPPNVWMHGTAQRQPSRFFPRPSFSPQFGNQRPQAPQAFITGNESTSSNSFPQNWYPDSGATHHVTPDANNLMDAASLTGSDQVYIGNGQGFF